MRGIEKFEGEIENFILNTFINFKPVKRFENRSGVIIVGFMANVGNVFYPTFTNVFFLIFSTFFTFFNVFF